MSTLYLTRAKGQPIVFRLPSGECITVTWERGDSPNHRFAVTAPKDVVVEYLKQHSTPIVACRGVGPQIVRRESK